MSIIVQVIIFFQKLFVVEKIRVSVTVESFTDYNTIYIRTTAGRISTFIWLRIYYAHTRSIYERADSLTSTRNK